MAKELRCRDLGIHCEQVVRAETEEELLRKALEHVLTVHRIDLTREDLLEQLRAVIHTVRAL